ncbi:hydroxyacylglutathione hydrolase [Fodinibius salinus]|uniref:Hydroxyacylglutathione hydrolase n=1 Tax=Fodinibius salinus TaxID=860790 RepID=A0A5D3YFE4_9BACT|nr:MBL fold metallo-hydrolase [Fodinibius salinus]TYP91935.1 hydroxyacylglutathione hydrolase [Fodinibius salinus]
MVFKQIYEEKLSQYTYLIGCQASGEAIIVDPMRDIDRYQNIAEKDGLRIEAATETHIHADYLSGLREFAEAGAKVYASDEGGSDWKYEWLPGSSYDYQLIKDGDKFSVGNIHFETRHTPGHTPEHLSYLVTDGAAADEPMGILTGDFIFVGDVGRPDLLESAAGQEGVMEASARQLFKSVEKFKSMPEYLQVWPGHGSGSACGKALGSVPESTVGYELRFNPSIQATDTEQHFVDFVLDGQPEPPLYFARMKRDNRSGPTVLGDLPRPSKIEMAKIASRGSQPDATVIDTRGRIEFMNAHLRESLLAQFDKHFNTIVGSYVDENDEIFLIINDEEVDTAIRDLVRIGLDNIQGYATPADLEQFFSLADAEQIETVNFEQARSQITDKEYAILDVRKATEFREGHIEGAVNIAHTRLADEVEKLDQDKDWLVYCRSGRRASVASALLKRNGLNVTYVNDQIEKALNGELVTT